MNDATIAPPRRAATSPAAIPDDLLDRGREPVGGWSLSVLAGRVKADLRRRFAEGDRPAVAEYLDALPGLRDDPERALSLIYEEFCLREEAGEAPDPDSFCDRYAPWRDSLASQLNYHRMISQAAGIVPGLPPRFPEPGEHFLRFRLRSVLGQGGAARVFLADDEDLGGRPSALKVSPDRGEEPSIMGRLQHPHIMPVHTVVRDPETGLRGLCMPYRPGRPLDQVLRRMENIPPEKRPARTLLDAAAPEDLAARPEGPGWAGFPRRGSYADACAWLAAALADALGHAHALEILHRDVKPANVLLSAADGPQLLDFNLAHDPLAPERAESALRGGTLPYMAPEQLEAFRDPGRWGDVGPTADLYALGLVLRELLTGRRPESPPADLPLPRAINDLMALRLDGWPPVRDANPAVPHALDAIVRRCLAHAPAARYQDASALADDLRAFIQRRPLTFATNPSRGERSRNWLRRHRVALAGFALVASMSLGVLANRERLSAWAVDTAGFKVDQARAGSFRSQRDRRLGQANVLCAIALKLDPKNYRALFGLGQIARIEERPEDAARLEEASIRLTREQFEHVAGPRVDAADFGDPFARDVGAYLAMLHLHRALSEIGDAIRHDPKSPDYQAHFQAALPHVDAAFGLLPFCEAPRRFAARMFYVRVHLELVLRRFERGEIDSLETRARLAELDSCLESNRSESEEDPSIEATHRRMFHSLKEELKSARDVLGGASAP